MPQPPDTVRWREAAETDVAAVVALLSDDTLGRTRETGGLDAYRAAFRAMASENGNRLIVGTDADGTVIACFQLIVISGLSLNAARRAQIEAVRVADAHRGRGIGRALIVEAEDRARAAGASLMQLTSNATRARAHAFWAANGYEPTHVGFKKAL